MSVAARADVRRAIAIVGAGVRGLVTLIQLRELLDAGGGPARLDLHLIDPWPRGGGRTWRADQSPLLLMNGPAVTVTAYPGTDPAGPTLLEWCRGIAEGSIAVEIPEQYRLEAIATAAESYPSRALYGWYLRWVQERTLRALPAGVRVRRHAAAVTDLTEESATLRLTLSDASVLSVDAAVLALGWLPRAVTEPPTRAESWIPPQQPADQDLSVIGRGSRVFLRGLGMNFFDTMVLLTEGRGGRFVDAGEGNLTYLPSGDEPQLLAGSRRGVPFRTKPAVPPSSGVTHEELNRVLNGHPSGTPWDFAAEAMPAIRRDAIHSFYAALTAERPGAVPGGLDALVTRLHAADPTRLEDVVSDAVPAPGDRIDLAALEDPAAGRTWPDAESWRAWLLAHLRAGLQDARTSGSPLRAAMRSIGEARPMIAPAIERDGLLPESVPPFQRFMRLGASLAGGPPPIRAAQAVALIEAGILEILGPQPVLTHEGDKLMVGSPHVEAPAQQVDVLLDAHLDPPDALTPGDPLLRSMIERGLARAHRFAGVATGAVEVELPSGRLVRADGSVHERLFLLGIPSEGQRVFTILSPKPGGDSALLAECAAAAAGVLEPLRAGLAPDTGPIDACSGNLVNESGT